MNTFWQDKHNGAPRTHDHSPATVLATLKAHHPGVLGMETISLRNGTMIKSWQSWEAIEAALNDPELATVSSIGPRT